MSGADLNPFDPDDFLTLVGLDKHSLVGRSGEGAFAGRGGGSFDGRDRWRQAVLATDWTRVLIEARGRHAREHDGNGDDLCGPCVSSVLLAES